jgi:hypothetical protein
LALPIINLQLQFVRMKRPVRNTVIALESTSSGFDGAISISCAAYGDLILKTLVWMTIGAEEILEESYGVRGHGACSLYRFRLEQPNVRKLIYRNRCLRHCRPRPAGATTNFWFGIPCRAATPWAQLFG